jgi:tRNA(Ile)-lysidine synthase
MQDDLITITRQKLATLGVIKTSSLILGLSGGLDSMTLAYVLRTLQTEGVFARLVFCHVNHKLRAEESNADAEFVRSIARDWNVESEIVELGVAELSDIKTNGSEASARSARYTAFERVAARLGIDTIVTAHTANDQAETVLMRLMRGAGPRGLGGIPRERKLNSQLRVIRPWLNVSREQIARFAFERSIRHHEDSTNATSIYLRNRVRHELLPVMQSMSPAPLVETLGRVADMMGQQSRYFDAEAQMLFFQEEASATRRRKDIELHLFTQAPRPIKFAALELLMKHGGAREMLSTRTFDRIVEWLINFDQEKRREYVFQLKSHYRLRIANARLRLELEEDIPKLGTQELRVNEPVETSAGKIKLRKATSTEVTHFLTEVYFDYQTLGCDSLIVRSWEPGDRMHPFGLEGSKLISNLLLESGLKSGAAKRAYPVVTHPVTGEILWLPGIRRSNACPITGSTSSVHICTLYPVNAH